MGTYAHLFEDDHADAMAASAASRRYARARTMSLRCGDGGEPRQPATFRPTSPF